MLRESQAQFGFEAGVCVFVVCVASSLFCLMSNTGQKDSTLLSLMGFSLYFVFLGAAFIKWGAVLAFFFQTIRPFPCIMYWSLASKRPDAESDFS